jgi:hypothetical protein
MWRHLSVADVDSPPHQKPREFKYPIQPPTLRSSILLFPVRLLSSIALLTLAIDGKLEHVFPGRAWGSGLSHSVS